MKTCFQIICVGLVVMLSTSCAPAPTPDIIVVIATSVPLMDTVNLADDFYSDSPTMQQIRDMGRLRVAVPLYLPFAGQDPETEEFFGVGIEVAEVIAEDMGVELEIVTSGWAECIEGIIAGQWDICAAELFKTPEREEVVNFVDYRPNGLVFAVSEDRTDLGGNGRAGYESLDKTDVRIWIIQGTFEEQVSQEFFQNAELNVVSSPTTHSAHVIEAGHADAVIVGIDVAPVWEKIFPNQKIVPEDLQLIPEFSRMTGLTYAIGDATWGEYLETVMDTIRESGELQERIDFWNSSPDSFIAFVEQLD